MDVDSIKALWGSGFVNRWHNHPDPRLRNAQDTTAAHQQRVALLVLSLLGKYATDAERMDAVWSAIVHDAGEVATGDVPAPAKAEAAGMVSRSEAAWFIQHGIPAPLTKSATLLRMCDKIDAILFVARHAPDLLESSEWRRDTESVLRGAYALNMWRVVREILGGIPGADTYTIDKEHPNDAA